MVSACGYQTRAREARRDGDLRNISEHETTNTDDDTKNDGLEGDTLLLGGSNAGVDLGLDTLTG